MKKKYQLLLLLLLTASVCTWAQGSTWQTAIAINNGGTGSSTLNDKAGEAWFKIEVPEEGKVVVTETVSGDLNLYCIALCRVDNAGNIQDRNTLGYHFDSGKTLEVTNVGKGTYYLHAQRSGGSGTATLSYQFTACSYANDSEPNNEVGEGDILQNGQTVQGRLGYLDANDYCDDYDYYKIEVPTEGRVDLEFNCDQTYELNLYSISFLWLGSGAWGRPEYKERALFGYHRGDGTLTITDVGKGTYYIKMQRSGGHGGYTLKYTFTPCSYANDEEPNDEEGSGMTLKSGETVEGRLGYLDANDYRDDYDWYKIEVPGDGRVDLTYECEQTYELNLYSLAFLWYNSAAAWGQGRYEERVIFGYHKGDGTLTITDVGKGTYYIRMQRSGGHGGYTLKYTFTPCSYANDEEPNDEVASGQTLENGQTVQGHLGYTDAQGYTDDYDWYKIDVPEDGRVDLTYECDQTNGLNLYILSFLWYNPGAAWGQGGYDERAGLGYHKGDGTLTITDVGKGTYYIKMQRSGGHGGYTLKYTFKANAYQNDTENNDELADVKQTIGADKIVTGHLGYFDANGHNDNHDWFRLDTGRSSVLTVTVEADTLSTLSFYNIEIVSQKGDKTETVAAKGYHFNTPATLSVGDVDDNATYYLHLNRSGGHGGYTIRYGAPERFEGSEIRIAYLGRNTTRLGIPSPYDVKVENIGSGNTGSFFIAIPATPDIEFLRAEIPTEDGVLKVNREDFAIYDGEEGDCAVFVVPNLPPFESYTFTVYMQGRVENASRSELPIYAVPIDKKGQSLLGALKSSTKKFQDNFEWTAVGEDGISVATVDAFIDAFIFDEKDRQQLSQAIGEVEHGYRQSYREPVAHPVLHYTQKVVEKVNPVMAVPNALMASGKIANSLVTALRRKIWLWIYKDLGYVQDEPQVMDGRMGVDGIVRSWDPNEMVGPKGVGNEHYLGETRTMDYRILFENKAEATDNAYRIRISDVLDENVFDVSTVRFGQCSHEAPTYNWKMKREGNKLSWDIEGIELPPNVNAPEGEGYVSFSVDLKPGLKDGTQIKNKAAIIFDYNETIETNEFVNTLDLEAPVSQNGQASYKDGKASVSCYATDRGSGVSHYLFYTSLNNGEDYEYLGQNVEPYLTFNAQPGTVYTISVLAVDNVGNVEETTHATLTFDPTAINDVHFDNRPTTTAVHTLDGRKVTTGADGKLPRGIYIIGNRKVVVK